MSAAHPWLETENWPDTPIPRDQLENRIERVLTMTNIGYLGTAGKVGPIVSPLEFYAEGLTVYIVPQPGSPKLRAMQRNPNICLAVANPMAGWACTMGCQLFGQAKLLDVGTPEWEHGMTIFKWQASSAELGRPTDEGAPQVQLLRLDPDRIVYTEHYMRKDGYAPRTVWRRDEG